VHSVHVSSHHKTHCVACATCGFFSAPVQLRLTLQIYPHKVRQYVCAYWNLTLTSEHSAASGVETQPLSNRLSTLQHQASRHNHYPTVSTPCSIRRRGTTTLQPSEHPAASSVETRLLSNRFNTLQHQASRDTTTIQPYTEVLFILCLKFCSDSVHSFVGTTQNDRVVIGLQLTYSNIKAINYLKTWQSSETWEEQ
jgi:hypothetical protein